MLKPGLDIFQTFNQVGLQVKRATGGSSSPGFRRPRSMARSTLWVKHPMNRNGRTTDGADTELCGAGYPNEAGCSVVIAGAAGHRFFVEDMNQSQGKHVRFSELRAEGARRQNRLLREIDRSRRGAQGQGKVRQELAGSILIGFSTETILGFLQREPIKLSGKRLFLEFNLSNPATGKTSAGTTHPRSNMAFDLEPTAAGYFSRTERFNRRGSS